MTEAELLSEIGINVERYWSMIQWWASVTFAVLLAAHLGAKQFNQVFVSIIIILYTLFSITIAQVIFLYIQQAFASSVALRELSEQIQLSQAGINTLNSSSFGIGISILLTLSVTYLATVFYVIYSFRRSKNSSDEYDEVAESIDG